jgi:hypothetical protein
MNKKIFLQILFIVVIGQLFLMQNIYAQINLLEKHKKQLQGRQNR